MRQYSLPVVVPDTLSAGKVSRMTAPVSPHRSGKKKGADLRRPPWKVWERMPERQGQYGLHPAMLQVRKHRALLNIAYTAEAALPEGQRRLLAWRQRKRTSSATISTA